MPILYVNPAGKRRRKARIGKLKRSKKRRMPPALARYWKEKRKGSKRRKAAVTKKRRAKASKKRRSKSMAKKKRKSSRRRGRKRSKKSYARAARLGHRRRRARKASPKRSRSRSRRKKRSKSRRRGRKRSRKSYARAARLGRRRRARKMHGPVFRKSKAGRGGTRIGHGVLQMNPPRKRRSRRRRTSRRRRAARRGWRSKRRRSARRRRARRGRYYYAGKLRGRRAYYKKNPGRMLMDLAKQAAPIVLATIAAKAIATKVGPKLPMIDKLGKFSGPVVSILAILGANFATKKVAFLAKRRQSILIGFTISAIHETIAALAPANIKGMLGMGDTYTQALADYVATNDYEQVVGMSDYVAVGDMEQELGLDQELGYTQDLGGVGPFGQGNLGGVNSSAMIAPVPGQKFLAPVPGHSFTGPVPDVTDEYDNPAVLYQGIFRAG